MNRRLDDTENEDIKLMKENTRECLSDLSFLGKTKKVQAIGKELINLTR